MKAERKQLNDYEEFSRIQAAVEKLESEKAEVLSRLDQIAVELSQPLHQQVNGGEQAWKIALEGESP
jgi:hypothetical protein